MANKNLTAAKKAKNDEFYTQFSDIEKELSHYKQHFAGKTVFCNCDDPTWSNFWRYFHLNFEFFGLKKLIATHYDATQSTYMMSYEGGDDTSLEAGVMTPLKQNGDFRSPECVELLKEAEILLPTWIQSHDSFENEPPFEYPLNPLFSNRYQHRKRSEPLTFISCPEHFLC